MALLLIKVSLEYWLEKIKSGFLEKTGVGFKRIITSQELNKKAKKYK